MKKRLVFLLGSVMALTLTACGSRQQATSVGVIERTQQAETTEKTSAAEASDDMEMTQNESGSTESDQKMSGSNILIAYFTVPETDGVDTVAGASRVVTGNDVMGNTQFVATEIRKDLGGDLFAIQTVQDYPGTHEALLDFAYDEKSRNARPELASHIENLDNYDYIFVGYPNWNADLPMPLYTFFDEYDFSGKTIIPFVTHGGSGFSSTVRTIEELEPNATVIESGLSLSRNNVANAQADIKAWADSLLADR